MNKDEYLEVLKGYKTTCLYLKQINSNKANRFLKYNNRLTITTVVFTVILSAIAFIDRKLFVNIFFPNKDNATNIAHIIDLSFNGLALLVLILTLINLLYRFQEKSSTYFYSVVTLSSMIRDMDYLLKIEIPDEEKFIDEFNLIETKYNVILDYLPQHTDKEFLKAKYDIRVKDEISKSITKKKIPLWKINFVRHKMLIFLYKEDKRPE